MVSDIKALTGVVVERTYLFVPEGEPIQSKQLHRGECIVGVENNFCLIPAHNRCRMSQACPTAEIPIA